MALATNMWITSPIPPAKLNEFWQLGRELIYRFSDREGPAVYTDKPTIYDADSYAPGTRDRDHRIGQGFCSMYDLQYHPLGLLTHPAQTEPDKYGDLFDSDTFDWYAKVSLDTTYGFRMESPNGRATWGCGDLHAAIVSLLGSWLDGAGISWCWENEFTGEIHQGHTGLDDLGAGGASAHNWFENLVKPALTAQVPGIQF